MKVFTLGTAIVLAGVLTMPAFGQTNMQENKDAQHQLKQEHKADKAQAKADKAERKALKSRKQKKADRAQDKANREADKVSPQ